MFDKYEDRNLHYIYRGIFWIKDIQNCEMICAKIICYTDGTIIDQGDMALNSKHGDNYNHKKTWSSFDKRIVGNRAFNYYPRGRVEIKNGVAKIFLNPHINEEMIIELIKKEFNLISESGITKVKVIPDYSEHYHCYLDEE